MQIFGILSGLFARFLGLQALLSVLAVFVIGFLVFLYRRKPATVVCYQTMGYSLSFFEEDAGTSDTELDQEEVIEDLQLRFSNRRSLLGDETSRNDR